MITLREGLSNDPSGNENIVSRWGACSWGSLLAARCVPSWITVLHPGLTHSSPFLDLVLLLSQLP